MSLTLNAFLWLMPRLSRPSATTRPDSRSAFLLRVAVPVFWVSNWSFVSTAIPKTLVYSINTMVLFSALLNLLIGYRSNAAVFASASVIFLCLNGPVSAPIFCCFTSIVCVLPNSKLFVAERGKIDGNNAPGTDLNIVGVFAFFLAANLFYHSNGTSYRINAIDVSLFLAFSLFFNF